MRYFVLIVAFLTAAFVGFVGGVVIGKDLQQISQITDAVPVVREKPLERYAIEKLANTSFPNGQIKIIEEELFSHEFSPDLSGKNTKTVTGAINIPEGAGPFPAILMIRGFVDQDVYNTGMGTSRAAEVFSENGYITIAPDFLGFGGSSAEAEDIFETRFQTYTTVMSILSSLDSLKEWDGRNIFIWAHSNGGQIALTTLAITGKAIPTTLWSPVSETFPYSVLFYSNEPDDDGKFLRLELAGFEKIYNAEEYSFNNYLERVRSPIQIQHGTADQAVPVSWSENLEERLTELEIDSQLITRDGANHNLLPAWEAAVSADLSFFQKHIDKGAKAGAL